MTGFGRWSMAAGRRRLSRQDGDRPLRVLLADHSVVNRVIIVKPE